MSILIMINNSLYREEILDHYKNPLNFGKLKKFDVSSKQLNPFCGDEIEMFVKFKKDTIENVGFTAKGCAISIASASILTNYVKKKTKKQLTKFSEKDMLALLRIEVSETRKKCALLALTTLKDCFYDL